MRAIFRGIRFYILIPLFFGGGTLLVGIGGGETNCGIKWLLLIFGALLTAAGVLFNTIDARKYSRTQKELDGKIKELSEEKRQLMKEKHEFAKELCLVPMGQLVEDLSSIQHRVHSFRGIVSDLKYRANLMLPDKNGNLHIWVSVNMSGDPDENIVFPKGTGCCGKAFEKGEATLAELTEGSAAEYGLTKELKQMTAHLNAVLSVPLFNKNRPVGIFNVDTTGKLDASIFGVKDVQGAVLMTANSIAKAIRKTDNTIWNVFKKTCGQKF